MRRIANDKMTQTTQKPAHNPLTLWFLMFGNFIIGTGIILPAGLLNEFTADFNISNARAGQLLLLAGIVVGFGAPLFAAFTSRIDRRLLLTAALVVYGLGHAASALAGSFELQLFIRAITVIGAAIYTPQAAATLGLLVPAEKRAGAIAFIFIGWSAATVLGIPLGGLLASAFGWRLVYGLVAALALLSALCVWLVIKPGLRVPPLDFAAWKKPLTSPAILLVFVVTLLSFSGQFIVFGYIAPILRDGFAGLPHHISIVFLALGLAGIVGNSLASQLAGTVKVETIIAAALVAMCLSFVGYGIFWGSLFSAIAFSAVWGLGQFSANSLQQSRLVALAPQIAAATVALNTSVVYLGQAIGSHVGGLFVDNGLIRQTPFAALAFMACAVGVSLLATRLAKPD